MNKVNVIFYFSAFVAFLALNVEALPQCEAHRAVDLMNNRTMFRALVEVLKESDIYILSEDRAELGRDPKQIEYIAEAVVTRYGLQNSGFRW